MIRLIAFDLDGTLLGHDGRVSDRTVATLQRAMAAGVRITIASGRLHGSAALFAERVGVGGPIITSNGGLIRDLAGSTVLHRPLGPEVFTVAFRVAEATGVGVELYAGSLMYVTRMKEPKRDHRGYGVYPLTAYRSGMPEPEKFYLVDDDREKLMAAGRLAREMLGAGPTYTSSGADNIEVTAPETDKGSAVAWLAGHYGIPLEQVMVVGDNLNDMSMFERAGVGVAMGNARAELKAIARYVTGSNEEDGAAEAVERLVLQGGWLKAGAR